MVKGVIGLVGVRGSGKDFTAEKIKREAATVGSTVEIIAFADYLREYIFEKFNVKFNPNFTYDDFKRTFYTYNGKPKTGRQLLEEIGDEFTKRDVFYFVKRTLKRISESQADIVVIPDVRLGREVFGLKYQSLQLDYSMNFQFCDFWSERYDETYTQTNELALSVRSAGIKDGQDISSLFNYR